MTLQTYNVYFSPPFLFSFKALYFGWLYFVFAFGTMYVHTFDFVYMVFMLHGLWIVFVVYVFVKMCMCMFRYMYVVYVFVDVYGYVWVYVCRLCICGCVWTSGLNPSRGPVHARPDSANIGVYSSVSSISASVGTYSPSGPISVNVGSYSPHEAHSGKCWVLLLPRGLIWQVL